MNDSIVKSTHSWAVCLGLFALMMACSSDPEIDDRDVDVDDVEGVDAHRDTGPEEPGRVVIDLDAYLGEPVSGDHGLAVYEITDSAQAITGASAISREGDYILENNLVRFAIQKDDRVMRPCPWGGNVVDAESRSPDFGGDILGEICLFLNADQTFRPHTYEILEDGQEGVAVLAVTGTTDILDYINLEWMLYNLAGPLIADLFEIKPDDLLPLTITKYYILRADESGLNVVVAMRNDGEEDLSLVVSKLLVNGADGSYFNPLGPLGGFGFESLGLNNLGADPLPFVALSAANSSVAFWPSPDERLAEEADLPLAGSYLTIFNLFATILGRTDAMGTLLARESELADMEGAYHISPGEVDQVDYRVFVGDGSLATVIDPIYAAYDQPMMTLSGVVTDEEGQLLEDVRVSAVDYHGRTMNQGLTDGQGSYSMLVPQGNYELRARRQDYHTVTPATVSSADGEQIVDDLIMVPTGEVEISVRTAQGAPTPARVSLICEGSCPHKATSNERDMTFDGLPDEFATVEWVGVSGDLTFSVPEGTYQVVVSRGLEWSLWEGPLTVSAGETETLEAEIARVIDTTGALSADFHVHTISSFDSTTPKKDRILSFLSEGVDVVVSSDHDVIANYGPAVVELGAQDEMVTLVGSEITTMDTGHFNAFPLVQDEDHRQGGSLDWAGAGEPALTPAEIFDWIRSFPGEQVVQVNHPDVSFMTYSDVLRGKTYGDVSRMRVRTPDYDPDTGETGLWSDDFTAMELMNGPDMDRFWGVARWWLTMIGRGHTPTGTAVTDTHNRYGRMMGGVPRTFVFVDDGLDHPTTFDTHHFVQAVNQGRAIGTNGPFLRVEAMNANGDVVSLGDTLETHGESVTFAIVIEAPEWVEVNRLEMVVNSEEVVGEVGVFETAPVVPTETVPIELSADDLEVIAQGAHSHRRYRTTIEIDVAIDEDAYVVFFVHGDQGMYPVLPDNETLPLAFTNPIYLDSDGQGYSAPPLAELAAQPAADGAGQVKFHGPYDDRIAPMSHDQRRQFFLEHSHQMGGYCAH